MARVNVVKQTIQVEVALTQEEYETLREFVRGYGYVRPSDFKEWRKEEGRTLWRMASAVISAVEDQIDEVKG